MKGEYELGNVMMQKKPQPEQKENSNASYASNDKRTVDPSSASYRD